MDRLTLLANRIRHTTDSSLIALDQFKQKLNHDPLVALSWGDRAFQAAANLEVARWVSSFMESEKFSFEGLVAEAADRVLRGARYPERSSSPSSNLAKQCEIAAWADLLDWAKEL